MEDTRNKLLALGITIGIMAVLGVGGYFIFRHKSSPLSSTSTLPAAGPAKLSKVSDDAALSAVATYDHNGIVYFNSSGELFSRNLDGSNYNEYTIPVFNGSFNYAIWPPQGHDFIAVANPTNNGTSKYYFDSSNNQYKLIPANVKSLDWMPDGKRIVYIWQSGDGKSQQLMLANADTSGYKIVANVFWPDLNVKVSPDGKNALLVRSTIQDTNKIYEANLESGQFTTIIDTGKNLSAEWIDSNRFVYVQEVGKEDKLMMYDLSAGHAIDLKVDATLDRISINTAGKYLYVDPVTTAPNEEIDKIDLNSQTQTKIYTFDNNIHARNLFMDDQIICFTNAFDNKLYTIVQ